jgi:hypothetical protein
MLSETKQTLWIVQQHVGVQNIKPSARFRDCQSCLLGGIDRVQLEADATVKFRAAQERRSRN